MMRRLWKIILLFVATLTGLSCATSTKMPPLHPYGGAAPSWHACPAGWGGGRMECLRAEVPLGRRPGGETTAVLVRRLRVEGASRGQLWALDGGPGFAGDVFFDPAFVEHVHRAGLDLLVVSHRGTRDASRLDCSEQKQARSEQGARITVGEWSGCLEQLKRTWGANLSDFSATGAARDVAYLMELLPKRGARLLFGGSYGTLWAQRVLLEGVDVDGVWLDSVVDLEGSLERVDAHADAAMVELFTACASVPECAARFQGAPLEVARQVISQLERGQGCGQEAGGWTREEFQVWAYRLLSSDPVSWVVLTAGFARAARCTPADAAALAHAMEANTPAPQNASGPDTGFYTPE
ncbi:MAG: hypothetical protein AAGI01_16060, partial [Myxococcota bacterium]